MVFAVQCPEPKCRKYMLVEEHDRGKVVPCLICKTPIRVGGGVETRDTRHETPVSPDDSSASHWLA